MLSGCSSLAMSGSPFSFSFSFFSVEIPSALEEGVDQFVGMTLRDFPFSDSNWQFFAFV